MNTVAVEYPVNEPKNANSFSFVCISSDKKNRILNNSAQTSFHPDRTLQMSIQSKYLWSKSETLEFGIGLDDCSRFSDVL